MKVRLSVPAERRAQVAAELAAHGIAIDDTADLVIHEAGGFADTLEARDPATGEWVMVPAADLIRLEAYGHTVELHTAEAVFETGVPLYRLAAQLDPARFLRVSHSSVIAADRVRRIRPTLSRKFLLTMEDGGQVDVTRTYYYMFKEHFGI